MHHEAQSGAALGKVSEGPHPGDRQPCFELRVAGLQESAKTLERKTLVAWLGIEPGCPAYMARALTTELLYHAGQLGEETPTDDP